MALSIEKITKRCPSRLNIACIRLAPRRVNPPGQLHRVHPFPHPVSCIEIEPCKRWQCRGVQFSSRWSVAADGEEMSRITSSVVQRRSSPVYCCLCVAVYGVGWAGSVRPLADLCLPVLGRNTERLVRCPSHLRAGPCWRHKNELSSDMT